MENIQTEKKYNIWIWILSITIPVVVAILFSVNLHDLGYDVQPLSFLPPIYQAINGFKAELFVFEVKELKRENQRFTNYLLKIFFVVFFVFFLFKLLYTRLFVKRSFGVKGL